MEGTTSKSESMRKKSLEARKLFNLPETESVIQDYKCMLNKRLGKMVISQNYICYRSSFKQRIEKIPFSKVTNIQDVQQGLFRGICIYTTGENYIFSAFVHRLETFQLLLYLWKNTPQSINKEELDILFTIPEFVNGENEQKYDVGKEEDSLTLNTDLSKKTLQLAIEIQQKTMDTMVKLNEQGEQIARIENKVDNINTNLDKTEKLIRGMESTLSYIGGKFGRNKDPPPVFAYKNKSLKVDTNSKPVDIEILCKNADDSFAPAILRLHTTSFSCVDDFGVPLKDTYHWSYYDIEHIILRSRPGHMDIRFFENRFPRFRIMSAYLQYITNELYLRSPDQTIDVIFEPGIDRFEYGDRRISRVPIIDRSTQNSFNRGPSKTASLLSVNASEKLKNDFDDSDKHFDQISNVLYDLKDMGSGINVELTEQNESLERIDEKVSLATYRLEDNTKRMESLMK